MRFRLLSIILIIVLLLAGGGYVALHRFADSGVVARQLAETLTSLTGRECRITGGVGVTLDPDPTLVVRGVVLEQAAAFGGQEPLLRVDEVRLDIHVPALFSGRVEVRGVELLRPRLLLLTDGEGRNGWDGLPVIEALRASAAPGASPVSPAPEAAGAEGVPPAEPRKGADDRSGGNAADAPSPPVALLQRALSLRMSGADLAWRNTSTGAQLHMQGLDMSVAARDGLPTSVTLRHGRFAWRASENARPATVHDIDLSYATSGGGWAALRDLLGGGARQGNVPGPEADGRSATLRLACAYEMAPGVTGTMGVEAALAFPQRGLLPQAGRGVVRAAGRVPLGGHPVPFDLSLPLTAERGAPLRIDAARLQLEQDAVNLTGTVHGFGPDATLRGSAQVRRLSLPRWFGFARELPAGLQHALDAISGSFEFSLDRHGIAASELRAEVLGIPVHGSGGVRDFAAPVIEIDVAGPDIDVNRVIPELTGASPKPPVHSGPPAIAAPGQPQASGAVVPAAADSGLPDVGYDIRVRAERAHGWRFDAGGLSFRCSPSREGTLLEFAASSFYGGSARAALDIVDDYRLQLTATDVALARPAVIVSGSESAAGRLGLKASVRGRGEGLAAVVASMRGTLEARVDDGFLLVRRGGTQERQPFVRLDLRGDASGAGLQNGKAPKRLAWTGNWRAAMRAPSGAEWEATASGPLLFDTATGLPVAAERLTANVRMVLPPEVTDLDRAVEARLSGPVRFDFDAGTLSCDRAEVDALAAKAVATVQATGLGKSSAWSGAVQARFGNPRATLRGLGIPEWRMADDALRSADLTGTYRLSGGTFDFTDARLTLDGQVVNGNVARISGTRPLWRFSLRAETFDADRYLSPKPAEPGPGEQEPPPSNEPLRYAWLRSFDADGRVEVADARFHRLHFRLFSAPIALRGGHLEVGPIASGFYGGTLGGSLRATAGDALATRLVLDARDFDLEPVGLRFAGKDYVGGRAMLVFDLQGPLRTEADMPAALSGTWAFEVRDGFYSSRGKSSTPGQERTRFSEARASGFMRNGVLHNEDFSLRSVLLTMTGRGWVDIARKRIDYTTDVSLVRVPTFPIQFTGDLRKPDTRVRQAGIVTGTLGNLGSGMFDLVGGIISMPLRVLEGLQDAARSGNATSGPGNGTRPGQ